MSAVYKWIEEHTDLDLIPGLEAFVRIPNQSRAFDPDWDKDGLNFKVCNYVKDWANTQGLKNYNIEIIQEDGRTPCVLAIFNSDLKDGPNILMYGHLDKQPPLTEQWSPGLHPYDPVIKDGKLYGRGAGDDGYAFFAAVLLLKGLQNFDLLRHRVVLVFETDEESGSKDLVYYLEKEAGKIGVPDLVVCLDSGTCDYDHLFLTTNLRGVIRFDLKVEVTKEGVHSGMASGIIPDSFRIGRKLLEQFESSDDGKLLLKDLFVDVPKDKYLEACELIAEMGGKIDWKLPFLPGVKPTFEDGFKQYMSGLWMPQMTLIGIDNVPSTSNAGNVLRPCTTFGISIRLPPTLDQVTAQKAIESFFASTPKPYDAKVSVNYISLGQGFNSPALPPDFKKVIEDAAQAVFNKKALYFGVGGSIPIINEMVKRFPQSHFIVTGVMGPESGAHGPDEFLHIAYLKKLICCLAYVFENYPARDK